MCWTKYGISSICTVRWLRLFRSIALKLNSDFSIPLFYFRFTMNIKISSCSWYKLHWLFGQCQVQICEVFILFFVFFCITDFDFSVHSIANNIINLWEVVRMCIEKSNFNWSTRIVQRAIQKPYAIICVLISYAIFHI